jgi:hypothetical protein
VVSIKKNGRIAIARFQDASYQNCVTGEQASTIFKSPRLAGFIEGRALVRMGAKAEWQRYPSSLEESLFTPGASSTPGATSTPRRVLDYSGNQDNQSVFGSNKNVDISRALLDSQAASNLVQDIPKFDGNTRNFSAWRDKIELARAAFDEDVFLRIVKQKLGVEATQFLNGLGPRVDSVDKLLNELSDQYDEYANPIFAHHHFQVIKQGSLSLVSYHSEIYKLLRGMRVRLTTKDHVIKSNYIASLTDQKIKHKLIRRVTTRTDDSTLEDLMNVAMTETRINEMMNAVPKVECTKTPISCNHVDCEVMVARRQHGSEHGHGHGSGHGNGCNGGNCKVGYSGKNDQRKVEPPKKPKDGPWCDIHETSSHEYSTCASRDFTYCKYCRKDLAKGTYGDHIPKCTAPRCFECSRLGHKATVCSRRGGRQMQHTKRERQDSGDRSGGRATEPPTFKRKVATVGVESVSTQVQESVTNSDGNPSESA